MPLGVALDIRDKSLFAQVIKIAEFNDLVENLLPHLLGLEKAFRDEILTQVISRIPASCTLLVI